MSNLPVRVHSLHVHPVKSCAGVEVAEALLIETGLELDRAWMLVDAAGDFLSQRELPRLALVRPTLKTSEMVLRAPGMLALHVATDAVEKPQAATLWGETVAAYDMGALCARWFSDFLGREVRLLRFDPEQQRAVDLPAHGGADTEAAFQDVSALLVTSTSSLEEVNRRLVGAGVGPVTMARFRPNIVLDGLLPHEEDTLDVVGFDTPEGPVRLQLVQPCERCPIVDVDPITAERGHAVGDVLGGYRADPRHSGAITFGMHAIVLEGIDRVLRPGLTGTATLHTG